MFLSDNDILDYINKNKLKITDFNINNLGPSSYDVTLGEDFICYTDEIYDTKQKLNYDSFTIKKGLMVCPLNYRINDTLRETYIQKYDIDDVIIGGVLGTTNEYVELPNDICAQYQGRSSFGRVFVQTHQTAGWIDAGFNGKITLEIVAYDKPVILYKDQRVGQLIFSKTLTPANIGYSDKKTSKYAGQNNVKPSDICNDWDNNDKIE